MRNCRKHRRSCRHFAALTISGIRYRKFSDRAGSRNRYLHWCETWAAQIRAPAQSRRLIFSQRRRRAVKSDVSARDRVAVAGSVRSAEHDPLDQVDQHRGAKWQDRIARSFQADQFAALSERLPRIYFSFHQERAASKSIGLRSVFRIRTRATLRAGRTRAGSDQRCRGNTWFIPYETIQSREKERPHPATFPVQLAEWCIKLHGVSRVADDARSVSRDREFCGRGAKIAA